MKNQLVKYLIANEIVSSATLIKVLTLRHFRENNFEITPEQFIILDSINDKMYQRELGILLGKDRANIARLLKILEAKGLIEKNDDTRSKKINRITITKKGIDLRNKILPVISNIRTSYLKNIDEKKLTDCLNTLEKIKTNIAKDIKLQT